MRKAAFVAFALFITICATGGIVRLGVFLGLDADLNTIIGALMFAATVLTIDRKFA
jgi:hypothetical protein